MCSWIFGVIFTLEVLLKVAGLRLHFLYDWWNYFDTLVVVFWLLDQAASDFHMPIDTMLLRIARLARLMRIVRLLKMFQGIDPLILMVTTIKGSGSVLFWAFIVLLLGQTLCAFLINQTLVTYYLEVDLENASGEDLEHRQLVFKHFGTFTRALFSMFELTLGNWVPIARILQEYVSEWFAAVSLLHKLTFGFACLGVINGIFVQETFKVAAGDDTIMLMQKERQIKTHTKKMKILFEAADDSGDGQLSIDEFRCVMANEQVRNWMAAQELDASDADLLFDLIKKNKGGAGEEDQDTLCAQDMVKGMQALKGSGKSMDLKLAIKHLDAVHEKLEVLMDHMKDQKELFALGGPPNGASGGSPPMSTEAPVDAAPVTRL